MLKQFIVLIGMCVSLSSCFATSVIPNFSWRYGTGSNIDSFCTTQATFYSQGKTILSYPGGGCNSGAPYQYIIEQKYYWAGGSGLPTEGTPVPDMALIEMVSFHDRKRYRIRVNLPADLEKKMRTVYQIEGRYDRRDRIYFGLAPGGYYEVVLMGGGIGASPDLLLSRGIAEEITDDWYDIKVPLSKQYGIDAFDKEYGELFKQHPVPRGMEWAPIMDAYRAKQPKTDQYPIK